MNEADTCRKYVLPKLIKSGWDNLPYSFTEQKTFTDGRIIFEKYGYKRGKQKRADYLLRYRRDFTIAVVEAKAEYKNAGQGMQQAKEYAEILGLKFAYATNGKEILEFDYLTGKEKLIDDFPSPEELWNRLTSNNPVYQNHKDLLLQPYYIFHDKNIRYYQALAINRTIQAISEGKKRILINMATGTGKTIVAFQICWILWNFKWNNKNTVNQKPKILFLSDRNILVDDPKDKTFAPFGEARYKIENGHTVKSRDIYFAIYQAISGKDGIEGLYKEYDKNFFDLIIVDECHRGSANDEGNWRQILEYFNNAVQIGMTATPLREENKDTYQYFGKPICEYSLKNGIEDGFLAPYKVYRVVTNIDATGWRPHNQEQDKFGNIIPDKDYQTKDFEKTLVLENRTKEIASYISNFMKDSKYDKTIVFCVDQEHADLMRREIANQNSEIVKNNPDYVCRVTADEGDIGKSYLSKFQDIESQTPTILTTSKLLSTGVDAPTVKNVILARTIGSMCEFKQIIGRGTRLRTDYNKYFFNIIDFTGSATEKFADPTFDGDPVKTEDIELDENGNLKPPKDPKNKNEPKPDPNPKPDLDDGIPDDKNTKKYYIDNIEVRIAAELVYELGPDGKCLNVRKYTDYAADTIRTLFSNALELKNNWCNFDLRQEIIQKLEEKGIILEDLLERMNQKEADPFDLICYLAFNSPLRTRRERAESLRKDRKNFFEQYKEEAREILNELLDKYADYGLAQFKLPDVLKLSPIDKHGNILEIAELFGGPTQLKQAIEQLQNELYAA